MSRARGAEPGFTLLELLVAMVILALTLVIAAPRLGPRPGGSGDVTRGLVELLGAARNAAVDHARIEPVDPAGRSRLAPAGAAPGAGGSEAVRFHPDGSASRAIVELQAGNARVRVRIEPLTGRVVGVDG